MTTTTGIVMGFLLGLAASGLKIFLTERFFLNQPWRAGTAMVLIVRILLDIGVLFAMHFQLSAMVAAAIGLTVDPIYFLTYIWRKKG
ncbi:hypothetical protein ACLGL1_03280 [Peptococcus simiae]|uniref:hypothetical protein n=1 Tax=Peptococcus simiae TaxID=1643805 RepID=UPI00398180E4